MMMRDMMFMLMRVLFWAWMKMQMLLCSTLCCMLLLMVMRLMGHQNHYDDDNMQHSVLQSSICIFIHTQKSTLISRNIMSRIIINRWCL